VRVQDEPRDVLQVIVVRDQLAREPVEQLRVRRLRVRPIIDRLDQPPAELSLPHSIHDHLSTAPH
jgi:hypothetical protein